MHKAKKSVRHQQLIYQRSCMMQNRNAAWPDLPSTWSWPLCDSDLPPVLCHRSVSVWPGSVPDPDTVTSVPGTDVRCCAQLCSVLICLPCVSSPGARNVCALVMVVVIPWGWGFPSKSVISQITLFSSPAPSPPIPLIQPTPHSSLHMLLICWVVLTRTGICVDMYHLTPFRWSFT